MACRKALIRDNDLGFLGKTLNSRYNYGYKFKQIFIKEIQSIYIIDCDRLLIIDIYLIIFITNRSIIIIIYLTISITNRSITIIFYYVKSVSHLIYIIMINWYN